ncbi:MAG: glycosyltransferase [Steroidobacteraceae bacterium]
MPNAQSLISIPLCTYNGVAFLRQQMDSLLQQTHVHFEIVAVDDCSDDTTVQLLHDYARRDARIRVVVQPENLGFRRNFEYALQLCVGDYIAPCDQDDIWVPEKLAVLLRNIGSRALIYCDSVLVDAEGNSLGIRMSDKWPMRNLSSPLNFVMTNCVSGHAMLFRRELLQQALPIPAVFFHDWWLAALAATAEGVAYWPEVLVRYRQHHNNVTDVLKQRDARRMSHGAGIDRLRATRERLDALASLPGTHQRYLQRLLVLWDRRFQQWVSIELPLHMFRQAGELFCLTRRTALQRALAPMKYLLGLRLKRWLEPSKYGESMPVHRPK